MNDIPVIISDKVGEMLDKGTWSFNMDQMTMSLVPNTSHNLNRDLSKMLPDESLLQYYKRCQVVLEDDVVNLKLVVARKDRHIQELEETIKSILVEVASPVDSYQIGSHLADKIVKNIKAKHEKS